MEFLKFDYSTQDIIKSGRMNLAQTCNGWSVKNTGTSTVQVQGDTLQPGESKSLGGNYGEVFIGRVDLLFQGAGVNMAVFTQKYYVTGKAFDSPTNELR